VPSARELVTWLLLHVLATGERLDLGRIRCRDVLPSKRRVIVWYTPHGFDIGSVADDWTSPGIGLASVFVPPVKRKK
jgi:hypothetical protein